MYIREAHTSDVWQDPDNVKDQVVFASPKSDEERSELGKLCVAKLGIEFPAVIDSLDDAIEHAYTGWPDRLYVIDRDGKIAYKAGPGPFGFKPDGVADTLKKLVPGEMQRTQSGGTGK